MEDMELVSSLPCVLAGGRTQGLENHQHKVGGQTQNMKKRNIIFFKINIITSFRNLL
jgi:hypothetical protein